MAGVADAVGPAHALDDLRQCRVVDMADPRKQVVLDLEIQSADKPRQRTVFAREIHRGLDLMGCPIAIHDLCGQRRFGEGGLAEAMGQLKDDGEQQAQDHVGEKKDGKHASPWMEEHGQDQREAEEEYLARPEEETLGPCGSRHLRGCDAGLDDAAKIIHHLPLDGHQPVEQPHIEVLESVKPKTPVIGGQPTEWP